MWESDSFDCSSVSSSSDSDLSSFYYGMKPTSSYNQYRLGDNFTDYRDMAAQRVLARLTSNPQLRNPERHPTSGDRRRNLHWDIPNTPEPPTWPKKEVTNGQGDNRYVASAAKTPDYLQKKTYEENSVQAYPSKPLPKILPVSMVHCNNSPIPPWDQHDEPPAPKTKKTSVLPPIGSNHLVMQDQNKHLSQPKMTVTDALMLLKDEDWEKKTRGLDTIVSVLSNCPKSAVPTIPVLRTAVMKEVTNLRSAVSIAAIKCMDMMFSTLQTHMDYNLQQTVKVLLHKAAEASTFIWEAVDSALTSMVDNVSPGRALTALIEGGLCHKNSSVRSTTVKHLAGLVDRMGPEFLLSGRKGVTDRAMPAVAKSVQDRCPQARMYGRKILSSLAPHPRLGAILDKYVPPKDLPAIKLLLKKCHK